MCKRRTQRERHELVEEWPAMGLKEVFWFYGLFRGFLKVSTTQLKGILYYMLTIPHFSNVQKIIYIL